MNKDKLVEAFSEMYRIRCYTLAELQNYLSSNGLSCFQHTIGTQKQNRIGQAQKRELESLLLQEKAK